MNERLIELTNILGREHTDGYQKGLFQGLQVAERIFGWYSTNHHLKQPKTPEILESWSQEALRELRDKIK